MQPPTVGRYAVLWVLLLLCTGLTLAQDWPEPGAQTWWAPDSGVYDVTREAITSYMVWDRDAETFGAGHIYEHEFRSYHIGFAKWTGGWSSNLPCARPYISEPDDATDEFSIECHAPYVIEPGTTYYTWLDMEPEDPDIVQAKFDLEAELKEPGFRVITCSPVFLFPWARATWDLLASFTAPATSSWSSSSSSQSASDLPNATEVDLEEYIEEAHSLLRELAEESPDQVAKAYVRFVSPLAFGEAEESLGEEVEVLYVYGIIHTDDDSGPHYFGSPAPDGTVESAIESMKDFNREIIEYLRNNRELIEYLRKLYEETGEEWLKEPWVMHMEIVEALERGDVEIVDVVVRASLDALVGLLEVESILLVDVRYQRYIGFDLERVLGEAED